MRFVIVLLVAVATAAACGSNSAKNDAPPGPQDAGIDSAGGPDASCFANPSNTHYEIINACTTAQKIYKNTHPPLEGSDGSLPGLP